VARRCATLSTVDSSDADFSLFSEKGEESWAERLRLLE
jgi:hypothetical protein